VRICEIVVSHLAMGMDVCLLCLLCVVRVATSATGWSLGQRRPTECVCECVCVFARARLIVGGLEITAMRRCSREEAVVPQKIIKTF